MKDYHPFVFDKKNQKFIGEFEEMYQAESSGGFDSWHQDDLRHLFKKVCVAVLDGYNFASVLDIGCGKGATTQFLKKANNKVLGLDLSQTALTCAAGRFPDINFERVDIQGNGFELGELIQQHFSCARVELIVCLEVLSYIEDWNGMLKELSRNCSYCLVTLFIPENPIGFVKTIEDLENAFGRDFEVLESIHLKSRKQMVMFGRTRH